MTGPVATAALGLAFVTLSLATRLPFQDRTLFISDSVRYALALERYDMTAGRPHPPGNPLYVALIGGLDERVLETHDRGVIQSAVADLIEGMKSTGARFVFASDHSISTNVDYDDYRWALDAYREHMAY